MTWRMTTPKGIAKFPYLTEPDTRFRKDGEYTTKLLLDADSEETKQFCAELKALSERAFNDAKATLKPAKAKALELYLPYRDEIDPDTGEPTGYIEITLKTRATYTTKDGDTVARKIPLFDSQGNLITSKIHIRRGSILRANFTPGGFYSANNNSAGITLYLNAVQVIQLREWGSATAEDYGFTSEEGGFVAADNPGTEFTENFAESAGNEGGAGAADANTADDVTETASPEKGDF